MGVRKELEKTKAFKASPTVQISGREEGRHLPLWGFIPTQRLSAPQDIRIRRHPRAENHNISEYIP
jgi:hypothetical protein